MFTLIPAADGPQYDDEAAVRFAEGWPEFIFHDAVAKQWNARRTEYFSDWEFYFLSGDRLAAGCWGVTIAWDGTIADLPAGYTDTLGRAVTSYEEGVVPNTFVLMAAAVLPEFRGAAAAMITAVRDRALAADLPQVIAPLRPTWKPRYPLTPIDTYATWSRPDGLPLDPWLRTHTRLGATVLTPAPASQTITGTVADWESWTDMPFPTSGPYVIPAGLSVLHIDREANTGTYVEPNIWVRHA
ncbi:hypothetical protein ABZS29_05900 [Kribbella sp. NPDC005582]|uniref:hypothetical protein n=1 Tax=Kribbella sp. NPDC005582 TaxID=3156893 RepID=UPI0033A79625